MRGFVPFAVCFAVLAQVWWMHHNFFRRYGMDDGMTAMLNFILLFVVLFYTYPLEIPVHRHFQRDDRAHGVVLSNGKTESLD